MFVNSHLIKRFVSLICKDRKRTHYNVRTDVISKKLFNAIQAHRKICSFILIREFLSKIGYPRIPVYKLPGWLKSKKQKLTTTKT